MSSTPARWKSISVFLDDTPQGRVVGDYAARLAHRFGAHLIGIHSITGTPGEYAADSFVLGESATDGVIARHRIAETEQALAAGHCLARLAAKYGISSEFRVIWRNGASDEALHHALYCDLVVLGHPGPNGLPDNWSAERLLMADGGPLLLIPEGWSADLSDGVVLVGWNASHEARRAVSDAMPLLEAAKSVTLLVVDPDKTPGKHGEEPGADIATYLARHEVAVSVVRRPSQGQPVAEVIACQAAEDGAGVIVIGAYSHARSAEMLFGGATRALLSRVPVPLLVSR